MPARSHHVDAIDNRLGIVHRQSEKISLFRRILASREVRSIDEKAPIHMSVPLFL